MLIDVEADGLAVPEDGAAAPLAHVVPDDPLVIPLAEALHRALVAVLPVPAGAQFNRHLGFRVGIKGPSIKYVCAEGEGEGTQKRT